MWTGTKVGLHNKMKVALFPARNLEGLGIRAEI